MIKIPRTNRFFLLLLTALVLLVYSNSFQNAFQYDDFHVILKNPSIKDPNNFLQFFLKPQMVSGIISDTSAYRPIFILSLALNYFLGGLDVFGFHLFNFMIHILCAFSVFSIALLFLRISSSDQESNPGEEKLVAFFAALFFAVHPVQTESVTYITGRSSSFSALFFLLSFLGYARYGMTGRIHQLLLSAISFFCGLLVKETIITLPLVLLVFNVLFPLGRAWKTRLSSLAPYIVLSGFFLAIRFYFFHSLPSGSKPIRSIYENLITQPRAWLHYLETILFPFNLTVDYDFPISRSILEGQVLFSLAILLAIAVLVWRVSKASRPVGFFALWFAINLLPTNSLIPLEDVVTDRWIYLPSVGFAVIAGFAARWFFRVRIRKGGRPGHLVFFFLCALVIELYGFATVLRNFTWTSYWTLWEDAVEKAPNKSRPHSALGLAFIKTGNLRGAVQEFETAIRLDPKAGDAYLNLGYIYFLQGDFEKSIQAYQKAKEIYPRLAPETHNSLGAVYILQGKTREAIRELERAIESRPLFARPFYNLGKIYEEEGDLDQAISHLEKSARLEPEFIPTHKALARLYEKKGWIEKSQEAEKNHEKYRNMGIRFFLGE